MKNHANRLATMIERRRTNFIPRTVLRVVPSSSQPQQPQQQQLDCYSSLWNRFYSSSRLSLLSEQQQQQQEQQEQQQQQQQQQQQHEPQETPLLLLPPPNPPFPKPKVYSLSKESQDKVQKLLDRILWLDIVEVSILIHLYAFKTNVAIDVNAAFGGGDASAAAAATPEPEEAAAAPPAKTIFDLRLVSYEEASKIKVIKEVRAMVPNLGLKEAKELVEGAPKVITKDIKQEQAEELKKKLEAVGAVVEIV